LMPLLTSCSIACGGHAGDPRSMRTALDLARREGVHVGAHPSYPDRLHFGRRRLALSRPELRDAISRQLADFGEACAAEDLPIHHVKPHGALYHAASADPDVAETMLEALVELPIRPKLYLPPGSWLARMADGIFPVVWEGFLDRRYRSDGSLVPRGEDDALLADPEACVAQLAEMVLKGRVRTVTGATIACPASTFCVHSDSPGVVEILQAVHQALPQLGIRLAPRASYPPAP
jgi:5-oxoprolinase (ATP-hydrolysing) subunit A